MERRYFYVTPVDGGWEVREDRSSSAWFPYYGCSADALVAAVEAARESWESQRIASGVRVLDQHGQWRDELLFGSGLPVLLRKLSRLTRQHLALRSA